MSIRSRTNSTPYDAELYAAVHLGTPGDIDFYVRACAGTDPILELGCGVGRITTPLRDAGHEVIGIDIDASAVTKARQQGLDCRVADMREFKVRRRFARILLPYNSLYCLLCDDDLVKCFVCARQHLASGGLIIFDAYAGDALGHEDGLPYLTSEMQQSPIDAISFKGQHWDVYEESRWDPVAQRVDAIYTHVSQTSGETIEATIAHRYLTSHQLPEILERAGLSIISLHGNFDSQPFNPESELLVVRAGRWR